MRHTLLIGAAVAALAPTLAYAQEVPATPPPPATDPTATASAPASGDIVITGRLDAARASIQPSLGATTYSVSDATIAKLPGGDNQQFNQILLQLPGVAQDGSGQFHVRDDHNNLQYRINGTILPEGVAVFGQTLSPRLVQRFELKTGALPAQYGLRTAGIIDLTTKSGFKNGGEISLYGGSSNTFQPSIEYGGSTGSSNFFFTASYKRSDLGIEAVDPGRTALHDRTDQYQGFGYFDKTLGANDRVSFIGGYSSQKYEIPNPRGLRPDGTYNVGGVTDFLSENLDQRQNERTAFGILSLLHSAGPFTLQASTFARYSTLDYFPDTLGELLFNGLSQRATKRDFTFGGQVEGVYKLSDTHTLRGGMIVTRDRGISRTSTQVFPVDANGNQTGQPIVIIDNGANTEMTYSAYLQDEWQPFTRLTINFGGRFDHYDGFRSESQLSPRINAVFIPTKGVTIHAGYARYFSPPPFANIALGSVLKFKGTSALSPDALLIDDAPYAETQDYFDVGAQFKLSSSLSIGIDAYSRHSHRLLDEGQFGAPIILTPFNYDHGNIRGVEFNVNYETSRLLLYGNIAYAKAQGEYIVSSQYNFSPTDLAYIGNHFIYLDHDQTWTGSAGLSYRLDGGTKLGASMIYGSGLRTEGAVPNGGKLPGYAVFNFTASHEFRRAGITVRADVFNLADHVYEIRDGSGIGVGAPQYGQRRSFFFGISKSF